MPKSVSSFTFCGLARPHFTRYCNNAFIFGVMHHIMLALSQRVTKPRHDPTLILKRVTYSRIALLNWFTESLIRLILTNFYIFRAQANDVQKCLCTCKARAIIFARAIIRMCFRTNFFFATFFFPWSFLRSYA